MFHVEHLKQTEMNKNKIKNIGEYLFAVYAFVFIGCLIYLCAVLQSCSMYKQTDINGKTTIVTTDTTYINHNTLLEYQKKWTTNKTFLTMQYLRLARHSAS